jgi:transcriptional regulator GlxA family with amidase domain
MLSSGPGACETGAAKSATGMSRPALDRPPLTVGILLWPSFPLMSLAGLVESLRHAGDHGDASQNRYARWDILGSPGKPTLSSCGIQVDSTAAYPNPDGFDYVFVIGGLLRNLDKATERHRAYLRKAHDTGTPVVGVCTGIFVLAQEGLLEGQQVCVHPYHESDFRASFPHLRIAPNRDFVIGERMMTVLGGVSILPLMTRIIGQHFGPDRAAKTVHQMTLPSPDRAETQQPALLPRQENTADPRIQKALVILDSQAATNPSIATLARSLGLSERHFLRLFQEQVGRSPKAYLVDTKLRSAVWMLRHTSRSITEVAYAAGFSSGANLADHCKKRLRMSPTQIRRLAQGGDAES